MKTITLLLAGLALAAAGFMTGCGQEDAGSIPRADAVAVLAPAAGSTVTGTVIFAQTNQGVRVVADVDNLAPGPHGFHIHEFGDCRAPDALSAGGHFNPGHRPHGAPGDETSHAGDFGNIMADDAGHARLDLVLAGLALEGPEAIIGRSVIVHADPDDLKSQPTGGAGARLACGVIGIAR